MRTVILVIGIAALLSGALFMGQGLGLIMWPSTSPMLDQRQWAVNGAVLAFVGAFLIWVYWRKRT